LRKFTFSHFPSLKPIQAQDGHYHSITSGCRVQHQVDGNTAMDKLIASGESSAMRTRDCARIVVVNPRGEVLLLRYEDEKSIDPAKPDLVAYWVPPGGGVHAGESFESAAIRELACLWLRERVLQYKTGLTRQIERYFLAHTNATGKTYNQSADEPIMESRWWTVEAIQKSDEVFLPENLARLLEPVLAGNIPASPIRIATESV
jgi:hypothetical protein